VSTEGDILTELKIEGRQLALGAYEKIQKKIEFGENRIQQVSVLKDPCRRPKFLSSCSFLSFASAGSAISFSQFRGDVFHRNTTLTSENYLNVGN
jgi:hypothetical protein